MSGQRVRHEGNLHSRRRHAAYGLQIQIHPCDGNSLGMVREWKIITTIRSRLRCKDIASSKQCSIIVRPNCENDLRRDAMITSRQEDIFPIMNCDRVECLTTWPRRPRCLLFKKLLYRPKSKYPRPETQVVKPPCSRCLLLSIRARRPLLNVTALPVTSASGYKAYRRPKHDSR